MKLYSGDLSPYSAKVRMQIYAKGISDIAIELPPGFMTGQFKDTSPLARIPVLDLGGDVIPESEVISEYLEEVYLLPRMLGDTPRETAKIRTVSRIADMALFLSSPQAAYVNGAIIPVDGGSGVGDASGNALMNYEAAYTV